jgi:hypothetical protein
MTVCAAADGGYRTNATSSIDRAIRLSTAVAVLAVAGIAAYVSYWHAYAVVRAHGESGITARLEPATIDGLVYASSMVVLYAARHRVPVPSLARWLLGLGIAATLTANMAQGWSHGPVGAVVAAGPAVSLVGSYELLVWLIRTSGTAEHRLPAGHLCEAAACRAAGRSAKTAATAAEFPRRGERDTPDQERQPAAQVAGPPSIPASGQRDQAVPEAAVNDAAVAAYRLSAQAGNPLSNASWPRCSDAHPAAGRAPESPKRGEPRLQGSRRIRQSRSMPSPSSAPHKDPPVLEQYLRSGLLKARRTVFSVALVSSGECAGEVQQRGTEVPGHGEYDSGLRDRPSEIDRCRMLAPYPVPSTPWPA